MYLLLVAGRGSGQCFNFFPQLLQRFCGTGWQAAGEDLSAQFPHAFYSGMLTASYGRETMLRPDVLIPILEAGVFPPHGNPIVFDQRLLDTVICFGARLVIVSADHHFPYMSILLRLIGRCLHSCTA